MNNATKDTTDVESFVHYWTNSMNTFIGMMSQNLSSDQNYQATEQMFQESVKGDTLDAITSSLKSWHTIASVMLAPESISSLLKGSNVFPDMLTQFNQSVINSLSALQNKMSRAASHLGESVEGIPFGKIDESVFSIWSEIYEKEYQKFFKVPQLGLTREYQERINDAMDKFHLFQTNCSQFLRLLFVPFQRSITVIQDKVAHLAKSSELPEDSEEYYQMWIKNLEDHFMDLFHTPEYVETLTNTVSALSRFSEARDKVIEDLISGLPVAPQSELDDLAKEMHELKRRLRRLEKKKH